MQTLAKKVFRSPFYPLGLFALSLLFLVLGEESFLVALPLFGTVIAAALFLSEDLEPCLFPFLCIMILGTVMLFSLERVLPLLPFGIPILAGFVFHFIRYRKPFRQGRSFLGLCAVSLAILLGGIGIISPSEYFDPVTLYYTLGLSLGLLLVYYVYATEYKVKRDYSPVSALMITLFYTGLLLSAVVVRFLIQYFPLLMAGKWASAYYYFLYRNTVANLAVIALPAGFYLAGYGKARAPLRLLFFLGSAITYFCLLLTASRTGILVGTVLFLLCLVYFLKGNARPWVKWTGLLFLALLLVTVLLWQWDLILSVFEYVMKRLTNFESESTNNRWNLILASFRDFLANPVFGVGLGSVRNAEIYSAEGCISWYHFYFPQIWGSMGCVGILAYGYQLYQRVRLCIFRPNAESVAVILSALGLFLYSQMDPGEFIPVPFAVLGVLLYVMLERHAEEREGRLTVLPQ